ncbi:hypothetical protein GCWU000246_00530 [Jonquetella anthropi E3_33 E1]|nr:hypothetical protein GCWU000246_00530 [Jonquetella anthropi E3_33 E1]
MRYRRAGLYFIWPTERVFDGVYEPLNGCSSKRPSENERPQGAQKKRPCRRKIGASEKSGSILSLRLSGWFGNINKSLKGG